MKISIICAVILGLFSVSEANAVEYLYDHFEDLYPTFGDNSTTVVNLISGPATVAMNRDATPGKQWIAESGGYQFKLTIEDAVTDLTIGDLVSRIEDLSEPYIRACKEVSDDGEQGIAIYVDLGGATAHGGKAFINMLSYAGPLVIAHEAGHVLEQVATEGDPTIPLQWQAAIVDDNVSVSSYGDGSWHEDQAEFSKQYAICLSAGSEYLDELYSLSPERFDLWEMLLFPPVPGDIDAPTPNPATFASAPSADSGTAISMTATTGTDASGPVNYYFAETSGNSGGDDSGWQRSSIYTDTGLSASTQYTYTVQMRDAWSNAGTASAAANATTNAPDTDAPTPNPATFASAPAAHSDTAISMTATTGTDPSGPVQYYFDETSGNPGGTDSGWQTSASYTDSGLDPSTLYTYTVQMRDSVPNTGAASAPSNATTQATPAQPQVTLSDGHSGDYRIIFVTLEKHGAKDILIGPYNTFVDTQAKLPGSTETKDFVTTWTAVGSTKLTSAAVNTSTTGAGTGIHIYTPSGTPGTYTLVAVNYTDLWDGSILAGIQFGDGSLTSATGCWTGTKWDGEPDDYTGDPSGPLGTGLGGSDTGVNANISIGNESRINNGWIKAGNSHDGETAGGSTAERYFMGMSGVISPAGGTPFNQPPAFLSDPVVEVNATEDVAYGATLANDASDPESDPMTFSKVSGPAWLNVASDGTLSGTPANADVGLNSFTVQVLATGGSDTATLEITVDNVNDDPVFTADPFSKPNAHEDAAYTGQTIVGSATDVDLGDTLTYSKTGGPAWLSVAFDGTLSGTPLNGDVGLNSFTVQVDDGNGGSDSATLEINAAGATPDTSPPTPNLAAFVSAPAAISDSAISMTAVTGSDPSGPVEYFFDETSGNPGGADSGWQTSASYTDSGLDPSTLYTYTVQMRDSVPNTGAASAPSNATTQATPDTTAPNPDPMTWAVVPAIGGGAAAGISYVQITDDADSGISSGNTYTHAIDWGTSGAATINGVVFANEINVAAGGRSNLGTRTYGPNPHGGNTPPAVSGDVASLFQDMHYGGPDLGYIELTGLTSGQWYDLRLYERTWGYQTSLRTFYASYDVGSDGSVEYTTPKIDQNDPTLTPPGLSGDVSYAMSYVYQADASGKIKVIIDLADDHTDIYHLYGVTNEELAGGGGDPETEISMTATTATDASGVEYFFDETSGNPGGSDSGWQDSPNYTDTGLSPATQYTYTVAARDKSPAQNATGASASASATTAGTGPDTTPPTPNPATFASAPSADSDTAISMTATTGTDASGPVEYFFDETTGNPGGTDSGWITSASYTDSGLNPSTLYAYTVQMRDSVPNIGTASAPSNATTQAADDTDGDGLLDSWETSFSGIVELTDLTGLKSGPGPGADTGDFDGDGNSDLDEFRLGLIPSDPTSAFKLDVSPGLAADSVELSWPSQEGLQFEIYFTDDLSLPLANWGKISITDDDDDGAPTHEWTDADAASHPRRFYRVGLLP